MKVEISKHAAERMQERNISKQLLMEGIQKGQLIENEKGQKRVKFKFDNNQSALMIGVVARNNKIVIQTVFIRGRLDNGVK